MGMGMSVSLQIWQQFVDLVFQDDLIKHKQNFDVIMDDMFIHSTEDEHMDDLMDLFKVLWKYGLKISPTKCHFLRKRCEAIQNLDLPKTLKQTSVFFGMVNFLSSFLLNLR